MGLAHLVGIVADEGESIGPRSRGQLVQRPASNELSFGRFNAMGAPLRSDGAADYLGGREEASDPVRRVSDFGGMDGGAKHIRGRSEAEACDRDGQYRASKQGATTLFDGVTNGWRFLAYGTDTLVQVLKCRDRFILDNLNVNKVAGVRKATRRSARVCCTSRPTARTSSRLSKPSPS
jgi:hypothetical protein